MKVNVCERSVEFLRPHCHVERKNIRKITQVETVWGFRSRKKS